MIFQVLSSISNTMSYSIKNFLRMFMWTLSKSLGFLLVLMLKILRHKSELLEIPLQKNCIRVFYSDAAEERGFEEWMAKFHKITLFAVLSLLENKTIHYLYPEFLKTICIVRGRKRMSFLLGKTFVFFQPTTNDEKQIIKTLINDIAWLIKRNECFYRKGFPLRDCQFVATQFSRNILNRNSH